MRRSVLGKAWRPTILATLLLAPTAFAQSTRGDIQGAVVDDAGGPLPGVTVEVRSSVLQGKRIELTDARGGFRFLALPPGSFKVTFALEGFQAIEQEAVAVPIGGTARLEVHMTSVFTEAVEVLSHPPVVDTSSTELGLNLSAATFLDIATDRDAFAVARVAPGAQTDACTGSPFIAPEVCDNVTFYGSTGAENAFYIDGVNTTGIEFGTQGKRLNFEFIQEVQVKTAGYGAEYGRAIGGLVNVITKSGGNEFNGDVFGYWDDESLQSGLSGAAKAGAVSGSSQTIDFTRSDLGLDLGGYILRDKLWFFGAYDRVENESTLASLEDFSELIVGAPEPGDQFIDSTDRDLWATKLTWAASPHHSFMGSAFGDPSTRIGPGQRSLAATPLHFLSTQETGATDKTFGYDGVLTHRLLVNARYSDHREKSLESGPGASVVGYVDLTDPLGDGTLVFGWDDRVSGLANLRNLHLQREQVNAALSLFVEDLGGSHELGAGYEFEEIGGVQERQRSGGQTILRIDCDPDGQFCVYLHQFFVRPDRWGVDRSMLTAADLDSGTLDRGIKTENSAVYLQDAWRPTSNLTLNLGVRWETQKLFNALGGVSADINDNLSPRLGFVWDPTRAGRAKIFAHWGRFYETIPLDIVIRAFNPSAGEIATVNFSDSPGDVTHDPRLGGPRAAGLGGVGRVDPDIEGEYLDEIVVGAEWELEPSWNVGLKVIRRDLQSVIEDALSPDLDYLIGNPGRGLLEGTYDLGYAFGYNDTLHLLEEPERTFEAVEVTVSKRRTGRFQLFASLLWSELKGSYDGSFQVSTGQLDPHISSAFDYFDFSVNNEGFLSNDRTWQAKLDGSYAFDVGLTLGLSAFYRTGSPVTAFGYAEFYPLWQYYLSERGAFGRVDDAYEADLHLGYPIRTGEQIQLNLLVDVFNLLDVQTETLRDTHYTGLNEDYQPLDWFTGETTAIEPGDPNKPPTNAAFNTTNAWTMPRRIRLGLRLSF
ncbi:MAG: TonB-dependent receptor [Acidobacteriota bacterium]|nr:TonB-dependent receptor [Acidobacteriota bacterium]